MNQFRNPLSKHDAEVLRIAKVFKDREYYSVKADLPREFGYLKPDAIEGRYYPDVEASTANSKKEWITVLVEVETEETVNTKHSKDQRAAFLKKAKENPNTHFKLSVV